MHLRPVDRNAVRASIPDIHVYMFVRRVDRCQVRRSEGLGQREAAQCSVGAEVLL